jgi:hypothetical protein
MQIFIETSFFLLIVGASTGAYYMFSRREEQRRLSGEHITNWIDNRLRPAVMASNNSLDRRSWLIVYHKYNDSSDGEHAICQAVTWAYFREHRDQPGFISGERETDELETGSPRTLVICQQRPSFLLQESIRSYHHS